MNQNHFKTKFFGPDPRVTYFKSLRGAFFGKKVDDIFTNAPLKDFVHFMLMIEHFVNKASKYKIVAVPLCSTYLHELFFERKFCCKIFYRDGQLTCPTPSREPGRGPTQPLQLKDFKKDWGPNFSLNMLVGPGGGEVS